MIPFIEKTIGQCLHETAGKYPQHVALQVGEYRCTWAEMDRITDLYAGRLMRDWGIRKGTHVGIWSVNTPQYVFTFYALAKIGAVTVVFNTYYKTEEMAMTLNRSDTEILFYGSGCKDTVFDDLISSIHKRAPRVKHFVRIDEREGNTWMSERSYRPEEKTEEVLCEVRGAEVLVVPQDNACIIFTSGTTSEPKGAVLTHFNIINDVEHVRHCMRWTWEDKMCVPVSMFHCFGLVTALGGAVVIGLTLYLLPYFRTHMVWSAILKHKCTVMIGVPSMYLALIKKKEYDGFYGDSLTSGIVGGSPLPAEEYLEICKRFPNMHLQTSFGMTEMSASVSFVDWDEPIEKKAVTTGKLMPDVEGRIVDPQTGKILGKNERGEIQFRGFNVFKEYYNMPEKTKEAFTEDGWFRTGDIGYFNDDDELCISGRLKEMIIRSGENISPSEIEDVIMRSGMVDAVKVVGVPDKFHQEVVAACIIPKNGNMLNVRHFCDFLTPRLAKYKLPQYILSFDEFPMTASGKLNLGKIKEQAAELCKADSDRRFVNSI